MSEVNESQAMLIPYNNDIICEKIYKNENDVEVKKYKKIRLLGKGGFADCYELLDEENKRSYAGKIISKKNLVKSRAKEKLISEIKIHKNIHHEHIVNFEHYFEDVDNVYILLELCQNQTLHELLKRRKALMELEVQYYIFQLTKALEYLHSLKIIHRDIKLANLFLTEDMQLKLGDFGLATKMEFDGERKRSFCGTPNYIAPEILDGKTGHSFEVDIWGIGIIAYILLIGKPPFLGNNEKETYKRIRLKNYTFPKSPKISEPARQFIQNILVLEPYKRPSFKEILESDFLTMGTSIPKALPQYTAVCPPNKNYIKQYLPNAGPDGVVLNFVSKKPKKLINVEDFSSQPIGVKSETVLSHFVNVNRAKQPNDNNFNITFDQLPQSNLILMNTSDIFVKKWGELNKFGLGYILSNDNVGVYFNDNTKMIYKPYGNNFLYIDSDGKVFEYYFHEELSKDLKKKETILKNFKGYLLGETKDAKELNIYKGININLFIYLKRFIKTKHAILFKLSNKTVQISFHDNTELLLKQETQTVTYINKKGVISEHPLHVAMDTNYREMTKRLRYAKKILATLMSPQGQEITDIHKVF